MKQLGLDALLVQTPKIQGSFRFEFEREHSMPDDLLDGMEIS